MSQQTTGNVRDAGQDPRPADLLAGVARIDITPPMPADCMGFVRHAAPATGVLAPLTATALVLEDSAGTRAVIVAMDLVAIGCAQADRIREMVGAAVGASPDAVFLNYSHTHAGPHATEGSLRKLGGTMRTIFEKERLYIEILPYEIVGVATMAARDMVPVRLAGGSIRVPGISVNRRERTEDGRTILGWNPDGALDDELTVLKFATEDGQTVALITNFACHPVVLGGENPNVGPDFPGALRQLVERNLGGLCLFLAGAAGNVLPLEGLHEEEGPEIVFGERLGYAALDVAAHTFPYTTHVERLKLWLGDTDLAISQSDRQTTATAAHLVRSGTCSPSFETLAHPRHSRTTARGVPPRICSRQSRPEVPRRSSTPSITTCSGLRTQSSASNRERRSKPLSRLMCRRSASVTSLSSGCRENHSTRSDSAVKEGSVAPFTLFAGYSNGYVGYFPTAAEYPFGGYEPSYSHHNTELLEQVAPESEAILVRSCLEAIAIAFDGTVV